METTLLIADDDFALKEVCQDYLTRCGFRVFTASNGIECLSILRQESPAVMVVAVDLLWGGADGLMDFLREESQRRMVPELILTGNAAEENVAALRKQSCALRYLRKPFLMAKLLHCVRGIVSELPSNVRVASPSTVRRVRELCTI